MRLAANGLDLDSAQQLLAFLESQSDLRTQSAEQIAKAILEQMRETTPRRTNPSSCRRAGTS